MLCIDENTNTRRIYIYFLGINTRDLWTVKPQQANGLKQIINKKGPLKSSKNV